MFSRIDFSFSFVWNLENIKDEISRALQRIAGYSRQAILIPVFLTSLVYVNDAYLTADYWRSPKRGFVPGIVLTVQYFGAHSTDLLKVHRRASREQIIPWLMAKTTQMSVFDPLIGTETDGMVLTSSGSSQLFALVVACPLVQETWMRYKNRPINDFMRDWPIKTFYKKKKVV